jgi:predicted enzyme related to lactoylglutathione lyase
MPGLAHFYAQVLGIATLSASPERIILESPDLQLIIHALPPEIATTVTVATPPEPHLMPLRLFFTVPALAAAKSVLEPLGGRVFPQRWPGPGITVCNAMDPEGNILQLRELTK